MRVKVDLEDLAEDITDIIDLIKRAPNNSVANSASKLLTTSGRRVKKRITMLRG
jgi:hypothetical protein